MAKKATKKQDKSKAKPKPKPKTDPIKRSRFQFDSIWYEDGQVVIEIVDKKAGERHEIVLLATGDSPEMGKDTLEEFDNAIQAWIDDNPETDEEEE
jgi:hypothetical protein